MHSTQKSLLDYGYHAVTFAPEDGRMSNTSIELSAPKTFLRDADFLTEVLDDEIFREMEKALQEQRVYSRENHIPLMIPPVHATSYGISDTDSSSSTEAAGAHFSDWLMTLEDTAPSVRRVKRAMQGEYQESAAAAFPSAESTRAAATQQRGRKPSSTPKDVRRRKRVKSSPKRSRSLSAGALLPGSKEFSSSGSASANVRTSSDLSHHPSPMTGASSRAEFEKMVSSLSTPLLMCIASELGGVREGKERVYCSSASRPPDHALCDPTDGRAFLYRKVIPHQHKPEKTGDPSPRCFACAARMMHERAMVLVRQRHDYSADCDFRSLENIEASRKVIITALGLPQKTRVFEYENVGGDPRATLPTKLY